MIPVPEKVEEPPSKTIETEVRKLDLDQELMDTIDDSMTPPLSSVPASEVPDATKETVDQPDPDPKAVKSAPKKNEWDMFAEQDLESNFDVS